MFKLQHLLNAELMLLARIISGFLVSGLKIYGFKRDKRSSKR
jgi:hypothetical protein